MNRDNKIMSKKVESLQMVDSSSLIFPLICVYNSPEDFPGKIIARLWESAVPAPTNVYAEYTSVEECEEDILRAGFTVKIPRNTEDLSSIVASYIR